MTPAATRTDTVLETLDEVFKWAKQQGFVLVYGWPHGSEEGAVHWNEEHGGGWEPFLECAKALGARALYVNWAPFEGFQVDDALAAMGAQALEDDASDSDTAQIEERRRQIEEYRERVGLTAAIDLAFHCGGVWHRFQLAADWFATFSELTEEDEELDEGDLEESAADKAAVVKWASVLANAPEFGACKNHDQRGYLLEQLAGKEFDTLPVRDILRRAETLYVLEVRPRQEKRVREEATELRKQGLSVSQIAQKLAISRARVSALLAD